MKQQTAIEWLVEEINKQKAWANPQQLEPLIDYALKKEKEQIKDAAKSCNYIGGATNIEAEQYYNETFKK
jgi:hypothetical protein